MISKNKIFLLLFCLFFLFANFCFVNATNGIPRNDPSEVKFVPQIGIPGSEFEAGKEVAVSGKSFIEYLKAIYVWSVGAIAVIAIIMIMIAGFQWMTAAGNASAIGQAKSRISSSLIGLLLAIGAYSLLNFVNPSLVHLRTLDLGDIEYVDMNIAEKICQNGLYSYEWRNHRCFNIMHNSFDEQYFPLSEFGAFSSDPSEIYHDMVLDLGVDDNYVSRCNAEKDFKAIEKRIERQTLSLTNPMFILLDGPYDDSVNPEDDFYRYIKNGCAGIMVIADHDADENLMGLRVEVANKSAGKASAYIKNIKIDSNKPCVVCCKKKLAESIFLIEFQDGLECSQGYTIINPSRCCGAYLNESCSNLGLGPCRGVEAFCGTPNCHWVIGEGMAGSGSCHAGGAG
ncbi:hypothetical protein B6D52_00520 [Candidatus Parcubacteria bacterium 4484_255]|nr:MAG: hypothetical protein B6D52_00520 [Candidatus Parcubacteria bacterium 4484_255]